jgi:hypothetical protein
MDESARYLPMHESCVVCGQRKLREYFTFRPDDLDILNGPAFLQDIVP